MEKAIPYRRRTFRKVYDLPDGNITVLFPKFISELKGVADHHQTDSVKELISVLQGLCLSEGVKPNWGKWTANDLKQEKIEKDMKERAARMRDAKIRRLEEREELGASFPDRAKQARKALGDY